MAQLDRKDSKGQDVSFEVSRDEPAQLLGVEPVAGAEVDGPIAVIVAHGMGQQVPFQTLGDFVEGLRVQAGAPGTPVVATTEFVAVRGGGRERISRLEATLILGHRTRTVHFYELYWAPLTEGVATLRDVTRFLFRAGISRMTPSRWNFTRWLFGNFHEFGVPGTTPFFLLTALAIVASLVILNAAIAAVAAARASGIANEADWRSPEVIGHLTRSFGLLLATFAVFLLTLVLSWFRRVAAPVRRVFRWASLVTFVVALLATIWAAAITAGSMTGWWPLMGAGLLSMAAPWADGLGIAIWPALVGVSWAVRSFLLQYIGDVAVYIEPQSVDAFSRARQAIRDGAMKTARTVYDTGLYSDIAFAGHSLGSVVAYDTLNQLLVEDRGRSRHTRLLLTFGSPLDKTAYLFGSQVNNNPARELLASSLQPLIQDAALRPRWVNIYSPWDIIGGSLDFYDNPADPPGAPTRVRNLTDPDATTLLAAHTEHWAGTFIYRTFIAELENSTAAQPPLGPPAAPPHP